MRENQEQKSAYGQSFSRLHERWHNTLHEGDEMKWKDCMNELNNRQQRKAAEKQAKRFRFRQHWQRKLKVKQCMKLNATN
jgi:hypothetical protein